MSTTTVKGILFAIGAAIFWGISGTFGQFLLQQRGIDVNWLITARMLSSGLLLLAFAQWGRKTNIFSIWRNRKDALQLLTFSIVGMLAVQYTYFAAVAHSNAATATILQYSGPIMIAGYLSIKQKRLPQKKEILAIFLAVAGLFLLVTHGHLHTLAVSRMALFLGLASAVALAIYTLQPLTLLSKYSPSVVIGWGMLCGGLALSFVNPPWDIKGHWDIYACLYLGQIILFGTLIAFTLYLNAVKLIGGQKASLLASAEPLAATVLAIFWLKTPFSLMDWIGSICIISTVFLLAKNDKKPEKAALSIEGVSTLPVDVPVIER